MILILLWGNVTGKNCTRKCQEVFLQCRNAIFFDRMGNLTILFLQCQKIYWQKFPNRWIGRANSFGHEGRPTSLLWIFVWSVSKKIVYSRKPEAEEGITPTCRDTLRSFHETLEIWFAIETHWLSHFFSHLISRQRRSVDELRVRLTRTNLQDERKQEHKCHWCYPCMLKCNWFLYEFKCRYQGSMWRHRKVGSVQGHCFKDFWNMELCLFAPWK